MRVLVVEDNQVVAQAVAEGLRDQGFAVDVAGDGAAGLDKAALAAYDVSCWTAICRRCTGTRSARGWPAPAGARILMLTGRRARRPGGRAEPGRG